MTTLAIVGSGIVGRSLLYVLAKEKKRYSKILIFNSKKFAYPCSLHSTAIVAPRGVTSGHSKLGDLLSDGFFQFSEHIKKENPKGVWPIVQSTGTLTKIEQFKKRYPQGSELNSLLNFDFSQPIYMAKEEGYLIDPEIYLAWLMREAEKELTILEIDDFVIRYEEKDAIELTGMNGSTYLADEVIFSSGVYNRFWKTVKSSRPIQGSYLKFSQVDYGESSFSITLDGDNLIYHAHSRKLLIGSTTSDLGHELAPIKELYEVYDRLSSLIKIELPVKEKGLVRVGLREKASKREPYILKEGKISYIGGFYKNGYSLGLKMARELIISE